jgi:DNA-binding GntR family transcriptional regulator
MRLKMYKGATVVTIPPEKVRDLFSVRRTIGQRANEQSAVARQEEFSALEKAVIAAAHAASTGQWQDVGTASLRFHQAIVALLDSAKLNAFFRIILAQLRLAMPGAHCEASFQMPWIARDRGICEIICAGKREEASRAMRICIADSEKIVLDIIRAAWRSTHRSALVNSKRSLRRA